MKLTSLFDVLSAGGVVSFVVGLVLRSLAVNLWQPHDGFESQPALVGAGVGLVLALLAGVLGRARPAGDVGVAALFLVLGCAASGAGLALSINGAFDRSPATEARAVVERVEQRHVVLLVKEGDAAGWRFHHGARLGTWKVGHEFTMTIHRGALHQPWYSQAR